MFYNLSERLGFLIVWYKFTDSAFPIPRKETSIFDRIFQGSGLKQRYHILCDVIQAAQVAEISIQTASQSKEDHVASVTYDQFAT